MYALIIKKTAGCDFDINDFEESDFEVHGWGWKGKLSRKEKLRGLMIKNE